MHAPVIDHADLETLLAASKGEWYPGTPKLPGEKKLGFHRVIDIKGTFDRVGGFVSGYATAELDIPKVLYRFEDHFLDDPVLPGCDPVDYALQLVGFYLGCCGAIGQGRARSVNSAKFLREITPEHRILRIYINMQEIRENKRFVRGVAEGTIYVDGEVAANLGGIESMIVR